MAKLLDNVYKYSTWIIVVLGILGYIAMNSLTFNGSIETTFRSWDTYTNLAYSVMLQLMVMQGAIDGGVSQGVASAEYDLADKANNKMIKEVNNEMEQFWNYTNELNKQERKTSEQDFLFSVGGKKVEELTKKELRQFKRLKPLVHDIQGFNLPLYYEMARNGKIMYKASYDVKKGLARKRIFKIIIAIVFFTMTVDMALSSNNLKQTFAELSIMSISLLLTFVMSYVPMLFKFKYELPKKVAMKITFYEGYLEHKKKD